MRITNNMLVKDMLWNSNKNLQSMATKQTELSTGQKIHRPSDDPVGTTQVLKFKTDIRESEQYSENVRDALGWLEVTESSLHDVKSLLQRVRELTVQATNGTNTENDTGKIKTEISELTKEVIVLGNSTIAGRYIFSGLETDTKLFNDDGTYNISMTNKRKDSKYSVGYEVSVGEVMDLGVHPADVFGVIQDESFFTGVMSRQSVESSKATKTTFTADVDITHDYSAGDVLDIGIAGTNYDVDESLLGNTTLDPLTKTKFINALKDAPGGTGKLGDVADVYFDQNDKLVVAAKSFGSLVTMTDSTTSTGLSNKSITLGVDAVDSTISSSSVINNSDVASFTETSSILVKLDGVQTKFEVDFSTLSTASDLVTELQSQVDAQYGAGKITVAGGDGLALDFTVVGTNDGVTHKMDVDIIYAKESELIHDLNALETALDTKDDATLQTILGKIDIHLDRVLTAAGEIGGKTNRIEFISNRLEENKLTYTSLLSKVQDVDMAESIMFFKNLENVYRASLSVGSKVIQPSLVDFIQ